MRRADDDMHINAEAVTLCPQHLSPGGEIDEQEGKTWRALFVREEQKEEEGGLIAE